MDHPLLWFFGLFQLLDYFVDRELPALLGGLHNIVCALVMHWAHRRLRRGQPAFALDAAFWILVSANIFGLLRPTAFSAIGILPALASCLLLPFVSARRLKRRMFWAFGATALGILLTLVAPQERADPMMQFFRVGSLLAGAGLILILMHQFKVRLEASLRSQAWLEERRSEHSRQMRLMLERTPAAVVFLDAGLKVAFINPAAERLFGWSSAEMAGADPMEFIIPPENRDNVRGVFERVRQGELVPPRVTTNIDRWGRRLSLEWINTPMHAADGTFLGLTGMATDVSQRLRMEEQLRHTDKMDAVGQLAFSRRQVMEAGIVDLNAVLAGAGMLLRPLLGAKVECAIEAAPDLGSILADPIQLEQVILNLAGNARDAMPGGGKLGLRTMNVDVTPAMSPQPTLRPGSYVSLEVEDTGEGIPPDVLPRIFDPFFTTKEAGEGTGLGLASVYGIVVQSGGQIFVESGPGKGTCFKIYFPRIEQGAQTPAVSEPARI